jgi:polyketide synthase PksL
MNVVKKMHDNALNYPHKIAVTYVDRDGEREVSLTFAELNEKAGALAQYLVDCHLSNKKVMLFYPTGIDFVIAYVACLYANVYPIPVVGPDSHTLRRITEAINTIMRDADTKLMLTTTATKTLLDHDVDLALHEYTFFYSDGSHDASAFYINDKVSLEAIAHIQYSSGTSATSKGIVITHGNLLASLRSNAIAWALSEKDISLSRSPHYYIYGLMTGLLLPLYHANTNYLLCSTDVIRDPLFWLSCLSKYQVTYSGCPHFGYQHCLDKVSKHDASTLDLSRWRIAICGGELIRASTFIEFANKFKASGFKPVSLCSSYGMTEMTGFVSSTTPGARPSFYVLDKEALRQGKVIESKHAQHYLTLVSSGKVGKESKIKIIDAISMRELAINEIGEICLAGPTLCKEVVNTHRQLNHVLLREENGAYVSYFRTGDEGFIHEHELYIVSRRKELIILNGHYYIPEEIEERVRRAHPLLSHYATIATCENEGQETNLLIFQEIPGHLSIKEQERLKYSIRELVLNEMGLEIDGLAFTQVGALPRTPSGKLRRQAAKELICLY